MCGQVGPPLTTANTMASPFAVVVKYGPPESCGQALVSLRGALPDIPITVLPTEVMVN